MFNQWHLYKNGNRISHRDSVFQAVCYVAYLIFMLKRKEKKKLCLFFSPSASIRSAGTFTFLCIYKDFLSWHKSTPSILALTQFPALFFVFYIYLIPTLYFNAGKWHALGANLHLAHIISDWETALKAFCRVNSRFSSFSAFLFLSFFFPFLNSSCSFLFSLYVLALKNPINEYIRTMSAIRSWN